MRCAFVLLVAFLSAFAGAQEVHHPPVLDGLKPGVTLLKGAAIDKVIPIYAGAYEALLCRNDGDVGVLRFTVSPFGIGDHNPVLNLTSFYSLESGELALGEKDFADVLSTSKGQTALVAAPEKPAWQEFFFTSGTNGHLVWRIAWETNSA